VLDIEGADMLRLNAYYACNRFWSTFCAFFRAIDTAPIIPPHAGIRNTPEGSTVERRMPTECTAGLANRYANMRYIKYDMREVRVSTIGFEGEALA
jgi:hypothetical protein